MISSVFRTILPLAALLAWLPALPAVAQDHAGTTQGTMQGMSGMSGMDMSGMDHGSMSMQGPMENMPGMQANKPPAKPNAAPQSDCRAMPGMAMSGGCGAQGSRTADPQPMPEAVRER